ncbi:MAG: DsbA family oxidoreductase [Solirubrobacterales bacterium]|nr:DsbA family oxidoreductase [Solirubrobacterales bacterium]
MKAEIFSDVACPFCYIGTRNFARALSETGLADEVEIRWRSFQLDPEAPRRSEGDLYDHLTRKFGITRDEARAMNDRVISMGHGAGIDFAFEDAFAVNTFDAHRMLQFAAEEGLEAALADKYFAAFFTGSSDLSDRADLVRLAVEVGADPGRAAEVAGSDEFAADVRTDQELAGMLGISGVPAFVFDRSTAVSGARPVDQLRAAIERAAGSAA